MGRNEHFVVVLAGEGETYARLARTWLGDSEAGWYVASFNDGQPLSAGRSVVVPRRWHNPAGIEAGSHQTVPVLAYHHFGPSRHRLSVSPEQLREQLRFLRDNDYAVVPLRKLLGFLNGDYGLPPRSVVITIDDGYQSAYHIAYPMLVEFGFPATIFPYSDFVNRGGLTTEQMQEMLASGLIDIQPHSKTHANLALIDRDENQRQYLLRLAEEVNDPRRLIARLLGTDVHSFAYPYGAVTMSAMREVTASNYQMAFTVDRHSNSFFAHPYLLGRTMIFNEHSLEEFAEFLIVRGSN